ncbi:MAG: hypothetical protein WCS69_07610 [Ignavibacteriaceae bacterium]|jgi:hypothetical protein
MFTKRIRIKSENVFILLTVLFLLNGCSKSNLQKDSSSNTNILPNILYTEVNRRPDGIYEEFGKLMQYQIASGNKWELFPDLNVTNRFPRFFPDNKKIILLAWPSRKIPLFYLININEKKRTIIDFCNELKLQDVMDGVSDIAVVDDTSFLFGFRDNLYLTSILDSSKTVLKNFNGKRLGRFSLSKSKNLLAFSYQLGFDNIKQEKLGLYNLEKDLIEFLDIKIYKMGNFSPSSDKLVFADSIRSVSLLDTKTREISKLKDFPGLKNIDLGYVFFINDKTLIILDAHKEYLYNLESKSIIKTTSLGIYFDVSVNY